MSDNQIIDLSRTSPVSSDFIDPVLSSTSIAYAQDASNFVALQACPILDTPGLTGYIYKWTKDDFFRDDVRQHSDAQEPELVTPRLGTVTYSNINYAIGREMGHIGMAMHGVNGLDWRMVSTRLLAQQAMIRLERQFASAFMGTSIWGTDLTPTNLWSDQLLSDPISDVDTGRLTILENTGQLANTLILEIRTFLQLRKHPLVRERLGTSSDRPQDASKADLARVFGVDRVLVSAGMYNSAVEGATFVGAHSIGKHALLCYISPIASPESLSAMYLTSMKSLNGNGELMSIRDIPEPTKRADLLRLDMNFGTVVSASDCGYFFNGAVA